MPWDLELNEDGSMPLYPQLFRGSRKIAQAIKITARQFVGEWLPDETEGMRYLDWIESNWADLQGIGGEMRANFASVDGVEAIRDFSITRPNNGDTIRVSFTVVPTDDEEQFDMGISIDPAPTGNLMPVVWSSFDSRRIAG